MVNLADCGFKKSMLRRPIRMGRTKITWFFKLISKLTVTLTIKIYYQLGTLAALKIQSKKFIVYSIVFRQFNFRPPRFCNVKLHSRVSPTYLSLTYLGLPILPSNSFFLGANSRSQNTCVKHSTALIY